MLELNRISAGYGKQTVFNDISAFFEKGKLTSIIGVNGCGKSTLLKAILGILPLSGGEITVDGENLLTMSRNEIAKKIAYLSQGKNTPDMTVMQMVLHGRFPYLSYPRRYTGRDREIAYSAMEQVGIADFAEKKIFNISGGEFQKCRLARCLVQHNDILLFDEPVENLDLPFQIQLLRILKKIAKPFSEKSDGKQNDNDKENQPQNEIQNQNGKTVLFSIHDINLASLYADEFLIFSGQTVIQGTAKDVFSEEILGSAFCSNAKIFLHPEFLKPQVLFF